MTNVCGSCQACGQRKGHAAHKVLGRAHAPTTAQAPQAQQPTLSGNFLDDSTINPRVTIPNGLIRSAPPQARVGWVGERVHVQPPQPAFVDYDVAHEGLHQLVR